MIGGQRGQERFDGAFVVGVAEYPRDFGALHTNEFYLIESKLKSSGAEYTTLETFPFVTAEA